jgi:hypothetical protein
MICGALVCGVADETEPAWLRFVPHWPTSPMELNTSIVLPDGANTLIQLQGNVAEGAFCEAWQSAHYNVKMFDPNGRPSREVDRILNGELTVIHPDLLGCCPKPRGAFLVGDRFVVRTSFPAPLSLIFCSLNSLSFTFFPWYSFCKRKLVPLWLHCSRISGKCSSNIWRRTRSAE